MFDIFYSGPKPNLFPHEKPANDIVAARALSRTKFFWFVDGQYDYREFDFTWVPPKWEEHQTHKHLLQSQFEQFEAVFAPTANVPLVEHWYDRVFIARKAYDEYWSTVAPNAQNTIDPSWCPNPYDPPYIYVFGNQWYSAEEMPTVEYCVPGATERKFVSDVHATLLPNTEYWEVPEEVNSANIDFSWVPPPGEEPYIYHFSSEFQMSIGLTYTVPGATAIKFETEVPTKDRKHITQVVSMFFVDMNNKSANARYASLQARYPDIQKIRYMNGWVETIKRAAARSTTAKFWIISSENVYDDFNFEWHAQPWQNFMTHVFASQWQKWSDTFLINKREFERHSKWAKSLEEFPNLNFVNDQHVYRPDDIYDIYYVDHFNPGAVDNLARIKQRYPDIKTARYVDNYLDTLKRILTTAETDYIWVANSVCDYSKFDFTWQPEPWQAKMLHVFPTLDQKFGDTFYIHVPSLKEQIDKLELLEWFDTVNYCNDQTVPLLPIDVVTYETDSVVDAIKAHTFAGPFAFFKHSSISAKIPTFSPSLWRKKDRVVHVFSKSGSVIAVPRDAKTVIDRQVYDYPYIMPHSAQFVQDKPLDIVYISNGEPDAERWYEHLVACALGRTVRRVSNVNGRSAAYKAAAAASHTPWFFAVFAKLEVNPEFDWDWQPDYMQAPKHYIFNAKNPVNGLVYGHQAIIAYNQLLTLQTNEHGLDFTLSAEHEVVDLLSGTAHYNRDPWVTWRTAFREAIKLRENFGDYDSEERLHVWQTVAEGENAQWSILGANDAVEYYDSVEGNYLELMKTYEWDWLSEYFTQRYKI